MKELLENSLGFIGATDSYEDAKIAIVGFPMDFTVSFRPGTRMGPKQIRAVSEGIEEYSFYQDKDLADYSYVDLGDVSLPFGNVTGSLERIKKVISQILADGKLPISLGGEHLVTYPVLESFKEKYGEIAVIQFDAHADLRTDYLGEQQSHATVMNKACQLFGGDNVYQLGIRSGTKEEFEFAQENTNLYFEQVLEPLNEIIEKIGNKPVYITVDIDVVDPAFAPGTGTPEAGGCTSRELLHAIIKLRQLNVVGFDIVEVSPMMDVGDCTSLLAAKLMREAILAFGKK
ncbi:MAG: agmatinase [Bacillota bacterium]|nr:agmatinase [Bacillota bacterium]